MSITLFISVCQHSKSEKAPYKHYVFMEIWLLTVANSEHNIFNCATTGYSFSILTWQTSFYLPKKEIHKKRHKNTQYPQRYCTLFVLTVVNSEQDILHSATNYWSFSDSNIRDGWIYMEGIYSKKSATKIASIHKDIGLSLCSLLPTVSKTFCILT